MTHFHTATLLLNGTLLDQAKHSSSSLRKKSCGRLLLQGCREMLDARVPPCFEQVISFHASLVIGEMEWQQAEPGAAFALFFVDDALVLFAVYLSGQNVLDDMAAVHAAENALSDLVLEAGGVTHPRLHELTERPLVVMVPFGGTEEDRRFVKSVAVGMGAAFFEKRKEEGVKREDVFSVN